MLLETILLHAEVLELKACPKTSAQGVVLKAVCKRAGDLWRLSSSSKATHKVKDPIYAGTAYGRVRSMVDDMGREVKELTPSSVASIAGLSEVPSAGSMLCGRE